MSTLPDNEFDLEKLFLPAWAQEASSTSKYARYEGEAERSDGRPERRGPRRDGRRADGKPSGQRRGPGRPGGQMGGPRGPRERAGRERGDRGGPRSGQPHERREPLPLPELDLSFVPEAMGVESLARQIKMAGRAYPLFDIAHMILQKPERYQVVFATKKNPEGKPIQPLFLCALDDTLWLSDDEVVAHVLDKHFGTFYQSERTATEPPKGKYTFVAQCGMSGVILGPPNHHDYQNQLRRLHAERFSRLPFEIYKSRVKIVRDEEVVKKWVEDQSWKTEYVCLNMPEALRLNGKEAVGKHFRENHKENIIKQTDSHTLGGLAARSLRSPGLVRLVRSAWEDQRRFPLQLATVLSQQFASHGLQFFKVNRTITHVCVARPHYLDLSLIPVSDGVMRIVEFINSNPKCSRRQMIEALAPSPPPAPVPVVAEAPPAPATPASPAPTPEQTAIISDLHWLIHQGHVIEFANGVLECAKKPIPKPPKPTPSPEKGREAATPPDSSLTAEPTEGPSPVAPPTDVIPQETESSSPRPAEPPAPPSAGTEVTEIPVPPMPVSTEREANPAEVPNHKSDSSLERPTSNETPIVPLGSIS